jgi:hypothetical protein
LLVLGRHPDPELVEGEAPCMSLRRHSERSEEPLHFVFVCSGFQETAALI